jgi:hypothetical protein
MRLTQFVGVMVEIDHTSVGTYTENTRSRHRCLLGHEPEGVASPERYGASR